MIETDKHKRCPSSLDVYVENKMYTYFRCIKSEITYVVLQHTDNAL